MTVAIALGAFVVVMAGIVWRRTLGYAKAVELRQLEGQRKELEADRSRLVNEIRTATSIGKLGPVVVRRLGMQYAADSQSIRLPMPVARSKD